MLSLRKPSIESLRQFVANRAKFNFSYPEVGASATSPPAGYIVDRTGIDLGTGEAAFWAAKAALKRWEHFQLGWVDLWSTQTPLEVGQVVAVMGRAIGLWWTNPCRIVYTVDEPGPVTRFGFAYGTLPEHVEIGEERFLIEWDRETGLVKYEILAFSRPGRIVIRVGYPVVRRTQKQFARDSAAAMYRAVSPGKPIPEVRQTSCQT